MLVGLADKRAHVFDRLVERRQEAVLAIVEQVVEGLARDSRPADHLSDGHARVADLLDGLHGGREHPAALNLGHLSTRQAVRARAQPLSRRARLIL